MRTRRLTGWGLGAMAAAALALAGCSAEGGTTPEASASAGAPSPATSSAAADPAAAAQLGQAAAALGENSFKITMTSGPGFKLDGMMDAPNGKGTATLHATSDNADVTVKSLLVGQDLYVQVPGLTKAGTWTHVDVARLPEGAEIGLRPGQIDPADTARLLSSTTDVRQTAPGSYAGSLDLTKAAGLSGVDRVTIDKYGDRAQRVPFTAGVDDQGRLSALTIQLPAVDGGQAQPLEVLYTDYGTTVTAERPAASEITEAPDGFYDSLGG
ncbi:hypothetical protein [Mangrovihabitans endophyticus]|uniref:Lipoprotein n=1 Tax=Mangrovihabitans endophyticus TaxID=1751298 RepID=A0A8J3C2P2_9ACTN|nr:hypothetical protein [Mangrovihabitans endophyticus]GGL01272.1 hypothetical protein GCM10012284_39780 [Mangrovihabitans endophyticus]